jgi:SSS family solute:Na+ symporter
MRYSQGVRQMAGIVAWVSGVVNYALFPAVGGRFLLHYCQLPLTIDVLGLSISTYGLVMALFLGFALVVALAGGQITIMVTDCVQGLFSYVGYAVVLFAVFSIFRFDHFREAMLSRPPGESFVNPFDTSKLSSFNILFVLIGVVGSIYNRISWQGIAGYNCAGANPHEQKMGNLLGTWRGGYQTMMIMLLVVGAFTLMNHPDFAGQAADVRSELAARVHSDSEATTETIRNQLLVPVAVRHLLPVGVAGVFAAIMLFLMISTDTTYIHAWGTMLIQDVVLPFRRKPFKPERQILLIRLSIIAVAVFAWVFAFNYSQTTYILMFFHLTGALYMGFAGSLILGGLYWRRGTTAGAYAAMGVGVTWALFSFGLTQYWGSTVHPWLTAHAPGLLVSFRLTLARIGAAVPIVNWEWSGTRFPVSGAELGFINILLCVTAYAVVSLLTCRKSFNLDRMLHRGKYAREDTSTTEAEARRPLWRKLTGITPEYTRGDRIIAWSVVAWSGQAVAVCLIVVAANLLIRRWSNGTFFLYWKYYQVGLTVLVGTVTTVWFTWGGTRDLLRFFRALKKEKVNVLDDGRVINHVSADDVAQVEQVEDRVIREAHEEKEP